MSNLLRVYLPQNDEEFPVLFTDPDNAEAFEPFDSPTNDLPGENPILGENKIDLERSQFFLEGAREADTVYQKLVFYNRAIDYDSNNVELYNELIGYLETINELPEASQYKKSINLMIKKYKKVVDNIEGRTEDSRKCSIPIIFDIDVQKRVDMDKWIMTNRREFPKFINDKFIERVNNEQRGTNYYWNAEKGEILPVSLFKHQKFISDFISKNTPYRGCLLYYGLGSGKTLSSISVAEGINKKVIIMLPASLQNNYEEDLIVKGSTIYHKQNHWCFVKMTNPFTSKNKKKLGEMGYPDSAELITQLHNVSGRRGFWTIDRKDHTPNFKSLSVSENQEIAQTSEILRNYKYSFLRYNGGETVLLNLVKSFLHEKGQTGRKTDFENRIVPYLMKKMGLDANTKYKDLDKKQKKSFKLSLLDELFSTNRAPEIESLGNPFDNKLVIIDEVHNFMSMVVNGSSTALALYQLMMRASNFNIITLSGTPIINSPLELGVLFNLLSGYKKQYNLSISKLGETVDWNKIKKQLESHKYVEEVYINRIKNQIAVIPVREGFVKSDKNSLKQDSQIKNNQEMMNDILDTVKMFKITSVDYKTIYPDIFFNKDPKKAFITNSKYIDNEVNSKFSEYYIDKTENSIMNANEFMYRSMGLVSFYNEINEYGKDLFPSHKINYVDVFLSDYQLVLYDEYREIERAKEKGRSINADATERTIDNLFKVYSRKLLHFVFPPNIKRPNRKDANFETDMNVAISDLSEQNLTINSNEFDLTTLSPKYVSILQNMDASPGLIFGYSQYRNLEGLEIFSAVLEANGYEEFRLGVDYENPVFEAGNKVRYQKSPDQWITATIEEVYDEDLTCKLDLLEDPVPIADIYRARFALWSGKETEDVRKAILDVYKNINNKYGQNLLILLTTASGAEGINLRFVRQVHIMEPYWNNVRVDQVIGRARRINSHAELPADQRNVEVFIYVMNFTKSQLDGKWGGKDTGFDEKTVNFKEITANITKVDKGKTSDNLLIEIAQRKDVLNKSFLNTIKANAVDCEYNREANIRSDPEFSKIKCVKHISGTTDLAYDIDREPRPSDQNVDIERQVNKVLLVLPYSSKQGLFSHLLYEMDRTQPDLLKLDGSAPVFNFYTYFGINPLIQGDSLRRKEIIGLIKRESESGTINLILHQNYIDGLPFFNHIEEDIINHLGLVIPDFGDEKAVVEFKNRITNDPQFRLEDVDVAQPNVEEDKKKKTMIRVNIV